MVAGYGGTEVDLDFKGTWKTRSGDIAEVLLYEKDSDLWSGELKTNDGEVLVTYSIWDTDGNYIGVGESKDGDWTLMENLSVK